LAQALAMAARPVVNVAAGIAIDVALETFKI